MTKVLDDGYVELIDVMGSDQRIVEAARLTSGSTGKDDRGLIRYLMRHRHCYDKQTEVLTNNGFMAWPEVVKLNPEKIKIGMWDHKKNSLCYESPKYFTEHDYEGDMYCVDHGGVDLMVTPDHKMYVKYGQGSLEMNHFVLASAKEIGHRSMVQYTKLAPYNAESSFDSQKSYDLVCNDSLAFLRLVGFFIGDGSVSRTSTNCIEFNLKKERKRSYLKEVCLELGWECRELSGYCISVHSTNVGKVFKSTFYNKEGDKKLPLDLVIDLNVRESVCLLDGLKNSDGSVTRSTWTYCTSVKEVAEAVQIVALHAGEAAHIHVKPSTGLYGVLILARMKTPTVNVGKRNTCEVKYQGKVYCANTRTGILIVRRNNKIVLCGNTTPFEFCQMVFKVRCPMDVWRQWIRHRMSSTNEYSTRYSEAIDSAAKTQPDQWRLQSKGNRQGSSGDHLDPDVLGGVLSLQESELHKICRDVYEARLRAGVAKEQARKDLPLSTYTEAYWSIDLHNLLHFLSLRMDSHAQLEIRQYANAIGAMVAQKFPIVWEAFVDYRLEAISLNSADIEWVQNIVGQMLNTPNEESCLRCKPTGLTGRELTEGTEKIERLGLLRRTKE